MLRGNNVMSVTENGVSVTDNALLLVSYILSVANNAVSADKNAVLTGNIALPVNNYGMSMPDNELPAGESRLQSLPVMKAGCGSTMRKSFFPNLIINHKNSHYYA